MLIGEERAVTDLWDAARKKLPKPRVDRPGQPVYAITDPPPAGDTGMRQATVADLDLLLPSCAAAHFEELGVDPLRRDADGFRWRTRTQIEEGRSWLWAEDGVIRFKAEASAWTPDAVQLQQVWTDPPARRQGFAGPSAPRPDPAAARANADGVPVRAGRERDGDQALRVGRDAPRARLSLRAAVTGGSERRARDADHRAPRACGLQRRRHGQRDPAGRGPLGAGRRGGRRPRGAARPEPIELGASSRFRRASETLALALAGRGIPLIVEPRLDEIGFGSFEGGSLAAYRAWAWKHGPDAACPGGGETRADAARRVAAALAALLDRPERVILAVTHGLPLRYVLDASDGSFPGQRLASVPHAVPFSLDRAQVERAAATLEGGPQRELHRYPVWRMTT